MARIRDDVERELRPHLCRKMTYSECGGNGGGENAFRRTFFSAYAVVAGQTTSYRPWTTTQGMCRLYKSDKWSSGTLRVKGEATHILSISCDSSN
jgi:hypothetical protein